MQEDRRVNTLPQYQREYADASWVGRQIPNTDLTIEELVAETNMSTVYRARSRSLARDFCAKFVPRHLDGRRRWELEIQILAEVRSPHVVKLFRTEDIDDYVVIVTDWAAGDTLRRCVESEGPFSPEEVLTITRQLALGLHEVHERGAVHRDLKPENIMIERLPSGDPFARILDFGIAKRASDDFGKTGFIGSPLYAAPEQITDKPVDPRTDLYSLGCVVYFALTGTPPFNSNALYALMHAHLHQVPPRPSRCRPVLRDWGLDELVGALLAKNPDERPENCRELLVRLESAGAAAPKTPRPRNLDDSLMCAGDGVVVTARRRQLLIEANGSSSHFELPLEDDTVAALYYGERERAVYWSTHRGRLFRTSLDGIHHAALAELPTKSAITGLSGLQNGIVAVDAVGIIYVLRADRCDVLPPARLPKTTTSFMIAGAANADTFVTAAATGEVMIYGGTSKTRCLRQLRPPFDVRSIAVSPDGYVAALTGKSRIWVLNLLDGTVLHHIDRDLAGTRSVGFQKGTLVGLGSGGEVHRLV